MTSMTESAVRGRANNRWTRDPKLNFPQPIFVGRTPFWDEDVLEQWDKDRARPRPVTADT